MNKKTKGQNKNGINKDKQVKKGQKMKQNIKDKRELKRNKNR